MIQDAGQPLNRKDVTAEILGIEEPEDEETFDLNKLSAQNPGPASAPPQAQPAPESDNPLIDFIDIGLGIADEVLKENGYPELKRKYWEEHGKRAMNKALNAYLPADSGAGAALDSPMVALFIGLGCLGLCLTPAVAHYMKQRKAEEEKHRAETEPQPEPERIPEPEAEILETDGDRDRQPEAADIAAIIARNHPQYQRSA